MQLISSTILKYYSVSKPVLLLYLVITLLIPMNFGIANHLTIEDRLRSLVDKHEDIFFEAIASLPDTKHLYSESIGKNAGDQCLEYSLIERRNRLNENQNNKLLNSSIRFFQKKEDYYKILKKINYWCIAKRNFQIMTNYESVSEETIFAALYTNPSTKSLFNAVLKNRGFDPKEITPIEVGATLASREQKEILCETLNMLSGFTETDLMSYFSDILKSLSAFKLRK